MEKRNKIYNQKGVNIFQRRYVQRKVAIQNQNRKSEELLYSSSIEKKSNISSLVQKNLSLNLKKNWTIKILKLFIKISPPDMTIYLRYLSQLFFLKTTLTH